MRDLPIELEILRSGKCVFEGATRTSQMKRSIGELAACLFEETDFPAGVFLMTGTGIVPPDDFTLGPDDRVNITVGELSLTNPVTA